ncbi:hypothetical protein [Paraburkholderia bryophila]|nr:hypothetical protein [Paraburkholderia bryophila]
MFRCKSAAWQALTFPLHAVCPIFNLLKNPQTIVGELQHTKLAAN